MTENETIEYVDKMSLFEKSRIYGLIYHFEYLYEKTK